jgi:hypothetical protein
VQAKIKVLNVVLNHVLSHDWKDYDNFSDNFSEAIIENFEKENFDLDRILDKVKGHFLKANHVNKTSFLAQSFKNDVTRAWHRAQKYSVPLCRFTDIFPELLSINYVDAKSKLSMLAKVEERTIQTSLRDALREKGASPMPRREKESPVEIADIEPFSLKVNGREFIFTGVVKGHNSLSKANPEKIMHQIIKAYLPHPDYVLLVTAKDPVDFLLTLIRQYSKDVGNSNLVIVVHPIEVVQFLMWQQLI